MREVETSIESLALNTTKAIQLSGEEILVCNSNGIHYAIQNRCTHQNQPLTDGRLRHGHISCPLHGVRFSLATGIPKGQLTKVPLRTYPVIQTDGKVTIRLKSDD